MNSGGDSLAKGAVRYQFAPAGAHLSQEAWDRIWSEDYEETGSRNPDASPAGDASVNVGEAAVSIKAEPA